MQAALDKVKYLGFVIEIGSCQSHETAYSNVAILLVDLNKVLIVTQLLLNVIYHHRATNTEYRKTKRVGVDEVERVEVRVVEEVLYK